MTSNLPSTASCGALVQPLVRSYVLPQMSEQERAVNATAVKSFAKSFLGHGCDLRAPTNESGLPVLQQVIEDFSEENINICNPVSFFEASIDASEALATEKLNTTCKAQLGFSPITSLVVDGGVAVKASIGSSSKKETNQITCIFRRLESVTCTLDKITPAKKDLPSSDKLGDHFVRSGRVYIGYDLIFIIKFESDSDEASKQVSGKMDISAQKIVDLKLTGEQLREKLRGKNISNVYAKAKGHGGYTVMFDLSKVKGLEDINQAVVEIEKDFFRELPHIKHRSYYIQVSDVVERAVGSIFVRPALPSTNSTPASLTPTPSIAPPAVNPHGDFFILADRMIQSFPEKYIRNLIGVLGADDVTTLQWVMSRMFQTIEEIFLSVFKHKTTREGDTSYTEIIGKSGIGKSLLIGYLLRGEVYRTQYLTQSVLEYRKAPNSILPSWPKVGHGTSETKGGKVYGRYIDTGGLLDAAGIATNDKEVDICNAMAISMVTRQRSPRRLIVLLPWGYFGEKGQELINFIKTLKRCVRNLTSKTTWRSIMFLVVDKGTEHSEEEIRNKIGHLKDILIVERDRLLPPDLRSELGDYFQKIKDWVSRSTSHKSPPDFPNKLDEIARRNPTLAKRIREFQENIEILELLSGDSNISSANYLNDQTRITLDRWQADHTTGNLNRDDFTMEHLVEGGDIKFKATLAAFVTYFNGLFNDKKELQSLIDKQIVEIQALQNTITALEQSLNAPISPGELVAQYKQELAGCEASLKQLKLEKAALENQIRNKKSRLAQLQVNTPIPWIPLPPKEPITPRSVWAYFEVWATTYKFEYKGSIPIHHVEKFEPTKNTDNPGLYFDEDLMGLSSGKYSISYRPAWYGEQEDSKAFVTLFVRRKDHPSTIAEIDSIMKEMDSPVMGLNAQIKSLETRIRGFETREQYLDQAINKQVSITAQKERDQKSLNEKSQELAKMQKKQEELIKRQGKIALEMESFKDFCGLIGKIIQSELNFLQSNNESESRAFKQFCDNVFKSTPHARL